MDTQGIFFTDFKGSYIPNILKEIYLEKIYAPYLEGCKDLTILDIGANIGLFSFYAYPFARQIYAIEPAQEHVEVMNHMLEFNKITNVKTIQSAISMNDGEAEFNHSSNRTAYSLKSAINDTGVTEKVKTMRLDTLFKEYGIEEVDFMKLDIEGSEVEVIGGEGFKNVQSKIKSLLVESHSWSERNPAQITTTLLDYGFNVNQIQSDTTLFIATR